MTVIDNLTPKETLQKTLSLLNLDNLLSIEVNSKTEFSEVLREVNGMIVVQSEPTNKHFLSIDLTFLRKQKLENPYY